MIEKIIVVAPTTAVPISTGLAVALNVLPAPSFSSSRSFALSNCTLRPKSFFSSCLMPGMLSITDSSNTDCALSVTGPYESTAIVTGPMPRKPNATRPNANTAGASIRSDIDVLDALTKYAIDISDTMLRPEPVGAEVAGHEAGQDVERRSALPRRGHDLPHVARLDRGEDLHQLGDDRARQRAAGDDRRQLPPQRAVAEIGDQQAATRCRSATTDTIDVSHTSDVSGASKFIFAAVP